MEPEEVAEIIKAANAFYAGKKEADWKAGVSEQLAEISRKVDVIIEMLRTLTVWLEAKIEDIAPNIFQHQIDGNILVIENNAPAVLNGTSTRDGRSNLNTARLGLTQNIGEILDWERFGFTYYYKVIAAIIFQLYATKALGEDPKRQDKVIDAVVIYLTAAVDPGSVKSIEHARQIMEQRRNAAAQEVINRCNVVWLTNLRTYSEAQGNPENPVWNTFYDGITRVIRGQPGGPFQYERSGFEGLDEIPNPWYPGMRPFDLGDNDASLDAMKSDIGRLNADYLTLKANEETLSAHVKTIKEATKMLKDVLGKAKT